MSSDKSSPQVQNNPKQVQKRRTTSDEDWERIVTAYENGATPITISQILNIRIATVYGIIKKYQTHWQVAAKKRGGNRPKALSQEAVESIRRWIVADSTITLRSLAEKVFQEHEIRVSSTTIGREVKEIKRSCVPATSSTRSSSKSTRPSKKAQAAQSIPRTSSNSRTKKSTK